MTAAEGELKTPSALAESARAIDVGFGKAQSRHLALEEKSKTVLPEIEVGALTVYRDIRKRKGVAVARVEKGTCLGLPHHLLTPAAGRAGAPSS